MRFKGNHPESAKRVFAIRTALSMTQEELAASLGVATMTVSMWERGCQRPSRLAEQSIRSMAAFHGLDLRSMKVRR